MRYLTKDLYRVQQLDAHRWEVTLADISHPVFQAHFESNPLLPAFLQIDIMGEILSKRLQMIERAKFKLPILPNETVIYTLVHQAENRYRIKIFKEGAETTDFKVLFQ